MHVLFAVWNAAAGGSVLDVTRRQAEHLVLQGWRVTLLSTSDPGWSGVEPLIISSPPSRFGRVVDHVLSGLTQRVPGRIGRAWDMRRVLGQSRFPRAVGKAASKAVVSNRMPPPDCIVSCQHFAVPGLESLGAPVVLVAHGDIFSHPSDTFSTPMRRLYERTAVESYRRASMVAGVSRSILDRARQAGAPEDRLKLLPNGVDRNELEVEPREWDRVAENEICYVGRLAPEKGLDVLIDALASLADIPLRLRVVGAGRARPALEERARERGVDGRVRFIGSVPRGSLGGVYASSDLFVLPSRSEARPVALLEAMACGLPAVATDVGDVRELIERSGSGLVVCSGDSYALAAAIRELVGNPGRREVMARRAVERANDFRWPILLERFEEIVHAALLRTTAPPDAAV